MCHQKECDRLLQVSKRKEHVRAVVTVRQSGSTIATSVVSDAQGRYRFPRSRQDRVGRVFIFASL